MESFWGAQNIRNAILLKNIISQKSIKNRPLAYFY
jgi:hypothetical protein